MFILELTAAYLRRLWTPKRVLRTPTERAANGYGLSWLKMQVPSTRRDR
jgi:hypothetical protein